jgi:RHS repeat-associated protein
MNKTEYKLYYFNANHLGSGSLITDGSGNTYQTLAYAPFGETLVNQFSGDYDEPYKFTGYERDRESGLDYAHARYYSIDGTFKSTDPMWWKYPNITPYNYCGNNPIMRVDRTGMDFDPENEKKAQIQDSKILKKLFKLDNEFNKALHKGKDTEEISDRMRELMQSRRDIKDMRNDHSTEYRYSSVSNNSGFSETKPTGTNEKGQRIITMYTEEGTSIHESRHGGQIARGEFSFIRGRLTAGYNVYSEISAYRAQYAYYGEMYYQSANFFNTAEGQTISMNEFQQKGSSLIPKIQINNINNITPSVINDIGIERINPQDRIKRSWGKLYHF